MFFLFGSLTTAQIFKKRPQTIKIPSLLSAHAGIYIRSDQGSQGAILGAFGVPKRPQIKIKWSASCSKMSPEALKISLRSSRKLHSWHHFVPFAVKKSPNCFPHTHHHLPKINRKACPEGVEKTDQTKVQASLECNRSGLSKFIPKTKQSLNNGL